MDVPVRHEGMYVFEPFRLDPVSRILTKDGMRIPLPARLFDTLLCLVSNHDRLVERDELLQTVWPSRTVDAGSLGRAISSLREVLKSQGAAENTIVTAPGRGYRFGARVVFELFDPLPAAAETKADAEEPMRADLHLALQSRKHHRIFFVAAATALALGLFAMALWNAPLSDRVAGNGESAPFSPPPHTVAVLPFANLSSDPKEDYLADGLSEELINELGSLSSLHVAASMSSFAFKGRAMAIPEIGRQLRVGAVLGGSIRREGERVRVTVQLVDAVTGYQMWSESYDRDQGDIFSLEGQIAAAVISSLKVVLLGDETARLRMGGTTVGRAFDAYLVGMTQLSEDDHAANRRAIAAFSQAIALDPGYALAYAQRAHALASITSDGEFADADTTRRMFIAGRLDAEKAIALAPELGMAHAALAYVLNCTLSDFRRVTMEYARAVALAPGNATILLGYARQQLELGHMPDAVQAAQHAATLDPLTPATYRALARIFAYAERFDEAQEALDRAHRLPPADPNEDRIQEGHLETWKGDAAAAAKTCGGSLDFRDDICLAWAYHRLGRIAEAENALARVQASQGNNAAYIYANIYSDWGRPTEALRWLDTAFRLRDPGLMDMEVTPMLAPLRNTRQFQDIAQRLDFPN